MITEEQKLQGEKFGRQMVAAMERRKKQQEPQELKSIKEKIQQQLLTMADLKAQIAVFQNSDNAIANNTDTTSLSDEQYQTTIIQKMLNHIKQKRT